MFFTGIMAEHFQRFFDVLAVASNIPLAEGKAMRELWTRRLRGPSIDWADLEQFDKGRIARMVVDVNCDEG